MVDIQFNQPLGTPYSPASMTVSPSRNPSVTPPPVQPVAPAPPINQGPSAMQQAAMNQLQGSFANTGGEGAGVGGALGTLIGGIAGLAVGETALGMSLGGAAGSSFGTLVDEI